MSKEKANSSFVLSDIDVERIDTNIPPDEGVNELIKMGLELDMRERQIKLERQGVLKMLNEKFDKNANHGVIGGDSGFVFRRVENRLEFEKTDEHELSKYFGDEFNQYVWRFGNHLLPTERFIREMSDADNPKRAYFRSFIAVKDIVEFRFIPIEKEK